MHTIRAAVLPKPFSPVEIQEFYEPNLEVGSAILDVVLSEVCGTDLHLSSGSIAGVPYPIIPGHVSVGKLREIRGKLTDVNGVVLQEGELITFLDVHKTCNICWYCSVAKTTTRCPERKVYGVTYGVKDTLAGGWAQSIYLRPNTRCIKLGEVLPETFMAGGCSLPTSLHAIERAEVTFGDTVLVLGSGPVGISSIILAIQRGAQRVLCIGAPDQRLQLASEVGAALTMNFLHHSVSERLQWVLDCTNGRGADVTIEATGNPTATVEAMRYTRDAGRVVVVGQYADKGEVPFNPHSDLNRKHLDVRGCWGSDFSHMYRSVQLMSDPLRSAPWLSVPLKRYSLENINQAMVAAAQGEASKVVIDPWL
jgi:threonine dehydrogenase-like Zn-dependent dehydrogenase